MTRLRLLLTRLYAVLAALWPLPLRRWLALRPYASTRRQVLLAAAAPEQTQREALRQLLRDNQGTEFGRTHAFDQLQDPTAFAAKVPLRTAQELEPLLARHRAGESGVLVAAPILGFGRAGGLDMPARLIPVTDAALDRYHTAERLLVERALGCHPSMARGCVLHLHPTHAPETTESGHPIAPMSVLFEALRPQSMPLPAAVPHALFTLPDEEQRFYLLLRLALEQPVSLLRAACPGTLRILADHLEIQGPRLVEDLARGHVDALDSLPAKVRRAIPTPAPAPAVARRLRGCIKRRGLLSPRDVWPRLRVLCCATTGPSRAACRRLGDRFGSVTIIDPGYQPAEGVVTWPWLDEAGGPLALGGQFIELLPQEDGAAALQPAQAQLGQRVQPVLTGPNGLYRCLLDQVLQVTSMHEGVAHLSHLGRAPGRVVLAEGALDEEVVLEGVLAACRASNITLAGHTAWMSEAGAPPEGEPPPRQGWFQRLLRRNGSSAAGALPSLVIAIEPLSPLAAAAATALRDALDGELRRGNAAYAALRGKGHLDAPELVVLKEGTFARRAHHALANGSPEGHLPPPTLTDAPWPLEDAEVATHLP